MKGQNTIYKTLFNDTLAPVEPQPKPERRGRSEVLKYAQDEFIVCRYYWYVKLKGEKYEATLRELQNETFLSSYTVTKIIIRENARLAMLQAAKPDTKYFLEKYPWLNWQVNRD